LAKLPISLLTRASSSAFSVIVWCHAIHGRDEGVDALALEVMG
jgi:hypothetical protein